MPNHGREYWRICLDAHPDTMKRSAKAAGYHIKKSADRGDTLMAYRRFKQGFLSYGSCSVAELRRFHVDRGLGKASRLGQRRLIRALEDADDNSTFNKLTDLPAELRCRIYHFYIAAFDSTLSSPSQPPLAQTCKLFRNEVLPIFFDMTTFRIDLACTRIQNHELVKRCTFTSSSYKFLASMPPQNMAQISSFEMACWNHFKLTAKLDKARKVWNVKLNRTSGYNPRLNDNQSASEDHIRAALGEDAEQVKPLTMECVYAIRRIVEGLM